MPALPVAAAGLERKGSPGDLGRVGEDPSRVSSPALAQVVPPGELGTHPGRDGKEAETRPGPVTVPEERPPAFARPEGAEGHEPIILEDRPQRKTAAEGP